MLRLAPTFHCYRKLSQRIGTLCANKRNLHLYRGILDSVTAALLTIRLILSGENHTMRPKKEQ